MINDEILATSYHMKKGSKVRYAPDVQQKEELEQQGYTCVKEPGKEAKKQEELNTTKEINSEEKTDTSGWNPKVTTTEEIIRGDEASETQEETEQTNKPKRRK